MTGIIIRSTNAKKESGLDNLFNDYVPQQLEEQKTLPASTAFQHLYQQLELALDKRKEKPLFPNKMVSGLTDRFVEDEVSAMLAPAHINAFLQGTMRYEAHPMYHETTGMFITKLIRNSYVLGHRYFALNTQALPPIDLLGFCLQGKELRLFVDGNVGHSFVNGSKNISVEANGNVDHGCAVDAHDISLLVTGDADEQYATRSYKSRHEIRGKVKDAGNDAQYCIFVAPELAQIPYGVSHCEFTVGDVSMDEAFFSEHPSEHPSFLPQSCVFRSSSPKSIQLLHQQLPKNNRIIRLNQDGTETELAQTWMQKIRNL